MGILATRSLWASQIHFLNDTQEFKYSVDIFKKVLSKLRKELPIPPLMKAIGSSPRPPSEAKEFLRSIYSSMEKFVVSGPFVKMPICVFSFSEKGDLLSQWRGYCPPGGGYSIGFRPELLIQFLKAHNLYLEPSIYDEKEQGAIVEGAVIKTCEILLEIFPSFPEEIEQVTEHSLYQFLLDFSRIASTLKHPSFHEECEWRIITSLIPNKDMSFKIRESMLLPYFAICLRISNLSRLMR